MKMTTEHFVDMGLITPEQEKEVNALIDESKGITLEKLLLERKFVTEEVIAETYSKVHGCCYCDVSAADIPENVAKKYNREKALKYHAIPIKFDEHDPNSMVVAMEDPENWDVLADLRIILGAEIIPCVSTKTAIHKKIDETWPDEKQKAENGKLNGANAAEGKLNGANAEFGKAADDKLNAGRVEAGKVGSTGGIERYDVNEEFAHSGIIRAGNFYYLGYCVGNVGGTIEEQINGAFDHMEQRLKMVGLTLENVIQMDCLFRDVWNIPVMEKIIKKRFHGKYPVRKSIQTNFAHVGGPDGLLFQADGVAYAEK